MSKKEVSAVDGVLKYLNTQNRPYSVNDMVQNLHKEFGKTAVQKAVDLLVLDKKIKEKTYGKQKVYCADQSQFPTVDEKELQEMEAQIAKLTQELKLAEDQVRFLEAQLKDITSSLTTGEAKKQLEQVAAEVKRLEKKLKELSETQVQIPKEDQERIQKENVTAVKEWRKRKRMCMEMANSILENYPKPKKTLLEEMGIDDDEEYGVVLPR